MFFGQVYIYDNGSQSVKGDLSFLNGDFLQITHMLLSVTKESCTRVPLLSMYCSVSSLHKDVNMLNVHIFILSWLVSTEPELNIISGGLWKILTEPLTLLTASFSPS